MRRNRFFTNMEALEELLNRSKYNRSRTRRLTDDDYEEFDRAGDFRRSIPRAPESLQQVEKRLRRANAVRWMRLKHDAKWARKQLKKMGRNPDDLGWLLRD